MKKRKPFSLADASFNTVNFLIMTVVVFITLYPFWYVLVASFSSMNHLYTSQLLLWPDGLNLTSYRFVLSNDRVPRAFLNSAFIVVVGTAISMLLTTLGAYVLSKPYLPGRNAFTGFIVLTMLFSGGLIPFYMTVQFLGLIDTIWALIIPSAISSYNMIIMRNFLQGIPSALEESAHIDGATHLQVLLRIYLPLSAPVLATITLFYAVSYWNSFFYAIIFLNRQELQPIQVLLREVLQQSRVDMLVSEDYRLNSPTETVKMALVIVTIVPIIVIYPFLQKYFVKGVLIGSLKG
ncbi:MAG: carbohydrate ABC transporter permease [Oscillospiraceae bacterium]|jgi:putative aldouronate transport system permease protein|nr:carbohydrate ABC transporter permease [Oscillospiraceae bacterium]